MPETGLERRLQTIRTELAEASDGRYPPPRLIAVTKTHRADEILPLKALDIDEIGENRVQEITEKLPELNGAFRIHMIGRLQRNKVRQVISKVCMIQSLDTLPLAEEIHSRASAAGIVMPVLIEVSPAGEKQKGGIPFEEVRGFLKDVSGLTGISVRGLMAVMPQSDDEELLSGLFRKMRVLFEHLREESLNGIRMEELSMGMSGDYRLAAEAGATMVRIGSALLGPRPAMKNLEEQKCH